MLALLLFVAHVVVTAALLDGSRAQRHLGLVLSVAAIALPWLAPPAWFAVRAVLAIAVLWLFARAIDSVRSPTHMGLLRRMWYLTAPVDADRVTRAPRRIGWSELPAVGGYAIATAIGIALVFVAAERVSGPWHLALRWFGGLVSVYAGAEVGTRLIVLAHASAGAGIPAIQDQPIMARSIGEFWARRWNRPVSSWLRRNCHAPLARRGRGALGLLCAFVMSSFVHFFFVWVALGLPLAAIMAGFFALQAALIACERTVAVRTWPPAAARAWTVIALTAVSPLFVEPMIRLAEASAS